MKPCTKFIIALWVFFLLSLAVHAQRGVQTNKIQTGGGGEISRAELTDSVSTRTTYKDVNDSLNLVRQQYQDSLNNRVIEQRFLDSLNAVRGDIPIVSETNPFLQQTGFVWGNLDANLSYTEAQKKTIRRQNYLYFEQIIEAAKLTNTCLDFPGNTLQLHLLPNDKIEISDKQIVCLIGVDKKSKIEFYPKVPIRGNPAYVFEMKDGGSVNISNIHFLGSNNFARAECYNGKLRIAGDNTKIEIVDTVQIRTGFWNNSLINAKIGIKHTSSNNTARTYTIASYDSISRTITLSGAGINFAVDTNFADAGTLLAFHWNTDEIHPDTASRYSRFFRVEETNSYHDFIYGAIGELNFSKQAYLKLNNCRIELFSNSIYVSGGWLDYHFDDSYFQGDQIAITKYVGSSGYGNPSTIHMNRCELAYSGKELVANAVQPYGTQNGNLLFGSGAYNHPNTRVVVKDCYIHDNLTGAFRQFSDGPEKPSPEWYTSYFINCTFKDNAEYHLLASNTHKTVIQNCTFDNGKVYLAYSTDMDNTSLLNSYVNLYGYGNAQPKPNSDTVQLRVNFNRVKFHKNSTFVNGWSNSRSKRTVINFDNCDFELATISAYYSQKISTGNYTKVNINNAFLYNRNSITYPDIVSNTTRGTQVQGFIHHGHDVKLYADNIRYDTILNSIPIIPLNRHDYISGKISNSRLLGVEGQYSQQGSWHGLVLENVEYPYIHYSVTTAYNFKSGVDKIATSIIGTNNIYNVNYTNSIWTTSSANTYFISNSDSLKYVFWGANSITTQAKLQKRPWTGFSGAIRIVADTSFCIAPGGNIRISSPVCYNEGDVIELKYFPFVPNNETKTIVRDSILANGTSVNFNNGGIDASIKSYKPGLCKIYIDNSLVGTDNMNERVVGTTVSGYVGYLSDRFNIFFTTPPTNGSYVIIERVSVSQGIWKIID
jgi:hypothetical protein